MPPCQKNSPSFPSSSLQISPLSTFTLCKNHRIQRLSRRSSLQQTYICQY